MEVSNHVPLLRHLTRVELAKLTPEVEEVSLHVGDPLDIAAGQARVFFPISGRIEVVTELGQSLVSWEPGDVIHERELPQVGTRESWQVRAATNAVVLTLPASRFDGLLESNAQLSRMYRALVEKRNAMLLTELDRTMGILDKYVDELWGEAAVTAAPVAASVAVSLTPNITHPPTTTVRRRSVPWPRVWAVTGSLVGLLIVAAGLMAGHDPAIVTLGILVIAAANWLAAIIPDFVIALGISVVAILFNLTDSSKALSGFISPTWFTLLAVWVIGAAVHRTGLLYRMSLWMLNLFPPTYKGQSLAMGLAGFITTPFLPSGQSRVVMVAPLIRELGEALHYRRNSNGMVGLAMTGLIGFGLMYPVFLNGSTLPLLAYSLLPVAVQHQVTWLFWLKAALPLGILMFGVSYFAILKLYPPESRGALTREMVQTQLRILGRPDWKETVTAVVLLLTLLAFLLASFLSFQPAWIVMIGMLVLVALGIIDREGLKRLVDWAFLLFFGAVLSFAAVAQQTGLDKRISVAIIPVFKLMGGSAWVLVAGVIVLTFLVRLVIPAVQSVPILLISLTPVAVSLGVNPFVVSLCVLTMGTNFVIPQQSPFYMGLHAGMEDAFDHNRILKIGLVHALIIALGLLASVPYWRWLGLLP